MRLQTVDSIELETTGVRGDRRFYVIDDDGALANAKRVPQLLTVRPAVEDGRLLLRFPDDTTVEGEVTLGERVETIFYGRPVEGGSSKGRGTRRCPSWRESPCGSRGPSARATASTGGGWRRRRSSRPRRSRPCEQRAGLDEPVDGRRFRMTIGIDGVEPHAEDGWIGERVRLGEAVVVVREKVGRCAVTTRDPDTGSPRPEHARRDRGVPR